MDFASHAVVGAVLGISWTGDKSTVVAWEGAVMGVLPDLLGAPITEGYHLVRSKFRCFSAKGFKRAFMPGTTHRWDSLPGWILGYYYFLHTVWFGILFSVLVALASPRHAWWGPTMFLSHSFVDVFLHKDEPDRRFQRAIRPFWPLPFSVQLIQWSEIRFWGQVPLIPLIIQLAFWLWFLRG